MDLTPTEANPESMDFLSRAWCNFAVQALQPEMPQESSLVLLDDSIKSVDTNTNAISSFTNMDQGMKMDSPEHANAFPPWKSNDVNSWIWMQQAMHPEISYNSCFRKKWFSWNVVPFKNVSLKKWLKEIKLKRKEEDRLQRAEVHAASSVAGLAAALAAVAAEISRKQDTSTTTREAAVASAAALVAAQCAKFAEAVGGKRDQLSNAISSAMSSTNTSDILTLTAAASSSLKGAATLKARTGCKNRLNGGTPVLPIEDINNDYDLDFDKYRSMLAMGADLRIETPDGKYVLRSVSITLNCESKVILKVRKLNVLKSKKESILLDMHVELYKDSKADGTETCYLIVLRTNRGTVKLDMADDYQRYKTWTVTINHMLMLSASSTKYELQYKY